MNFFYVPGRQYMLTTGINWTSATLKALLVMTNSTARSENRATFLTGGSGFTTLDEMGGAGYSRQTLASVTITDDLPTGDLIVTCATVNFGNTITNGARQVAGIVIYLDGANDGARRPLIYLDSVSNGPTFPYSPNGGPIKLVPPASGLWRMRSVTPGP
jgi:hypothetical protein